MTSVRATLSVLSTHLPSPARPGVGVIIHVVAQVLSERALIGQRIIFWPKKSDNIHFHKGFVLSTDLPLALVEPALNTLSAGGSGPFEAGALDVFSVAEPCVRVPISLLRMMRGQEAYTERQRAALTSMWDKE